MRRVIEVSVIAGYLTFWGLVSLASDYADQREGKNKD